ncbi:uncharacterized protein LOC123548314 [Mercenaria mercenaria]|uniref:uncharacterized protein LOC123548314 n=1 Tax=Mercenaria mercenaria TaxID=6596 RepID=UPI00234EAE01|nr:uncharacterized protein LOC123548314 [Mercenaria mercenaria]
MADSDLDNAGVKAVITLGVLAVVGILAVIIAKLVKFCVKKHYTDIDENEIDENTRSLIRARLSVIQFKKREIKKARQERTLDVFTRWKELVKSRKKDRESTLKSQRPEENSQVVITIDKVTAKENGVLENGGSKIIENGSPRIPRFPFFTQSKTAGGAIKPQLETSRNASSNKVNTLKAESPVPRGRPVSSKQRTLPNVILTDVDINNTAKVHIKSVHFEDDTNLVKTESTTKKDSTKVISVIEKENKENIKTDETGTVKTNSESEKKAKYKTNSVSPIIKKTNIQTEYNKGNGDSNTESASKIEEKT